MLIVGVDLQCMVRPAPMAARQPVRTAAPLPRLQLCLMILTQECRAAAADNASALPGSDPSSTTQQGIRKGSSPSSIAPTVSGWS